MYFNVPIDVSTLSGVLILDKSTLPISSVEASEGIEITDADTSIEYMIFF
jgi:hypothetical protein